MATAYTALLGLALPVTGELSGTWGDVVSDGITSLLDTAVAGTTTLSADADVTLSTTTGAANQARQAIINCTGARSVLRTITAPAASKEYVVINGTTGGFGVKIVGVGPTTGITVLAGSQALVAWNGSDFVQVGSPAPTGTGFTHVTSGSVDAAAKLVNFTAAGDVAANQGTTTTVLHGNAAGQASFAAVSLTADVSGTLPVANGGTGASTLTDRGILFGNGTAAVGITSVGTAAQVLTSNGAGVDPSFQAGPSGTPALVIVTTTTATAVKDTNVVFNNAALTTITLPASPAAGDLVWITSANALTTNVIARNGQTIMGLAEDMTLNVALARVQLRFASSSWRMVA